jgi:hypothetical protein
MMQLVQRVTIVALAATALTLALGAGPAAAAKPCWQRVIDDWWDGRIDGIYSVACMRAAIRNAPEDITRYSDLESDITRALAVSPKVPGQDGNLYVFPGSGQSSGSGKKDDGDRTTAGVKAGQDGDGGSGGDGTSTTASDDGPVQKALGAGSDDPSSVPIPLIALGALALLLLASGMMGIVARRIRTHRAGGGPSGPDA